MQKKMQASFITTGILILAAALGMQSCKSNNEGKADEREKYVIPDSIFKTLVVDTVSTAPFVNSLTLTGKVSFNEDNVVKIYPMVSGNVQDIKVALGDYV